MIAAGEAPDILSPEFATDPYRAYRIMLEDLPLIWHEATNAYIISRYEDVMRTLRDPTFTTDNYAWQVEPAHGGRTIIQMSGHEHSVRRALVAPAFRGKELQQKFLPVIERNARRLIDGFREGGAWTWSRISRDFSPSMSSSTCWGWTRTTTTDSSAGILRSSRSWAI
jgi:pulcherriminic acid synthase